jgi:short subunit dehydrogenase-like uncharacterized protein
VSSLNEAKGSNTVSQGYTGLMTAEHIATQFPTDTKWAVAGRSAEKLQKVVSECKALNSDRIQPGP